MSLQTLDRTQWSYAEALANVQSVTLARRADEAAKAPPKPEPSYQHWNRPQDPTIAWKTEAGNELLVALRDGELTAGHGRVLAATRLGLTEVQRRAYRIADNRLAESPWNEGLLSAELQDLLADDYDLSLVGFRTASWTSCWHSCRKAKARMVLAPGAQCPRSSFQNHRAPRRRAPATSGSSATTGCSVATAPAKRNLTSIWNGSRVRGVASASNEPQSLCEG